MAGNTAIGISDFVDFGAFPWLLLFAAVVADGRQITIVIKMIFCQSRIFKPWIMTEHKTKSGKRPVKVISSVARSVK